MMQSKCAPHFLDHFTQSISIGYVQPFAQGAYNGNQGTDQKGTVL